MGCHLYLSANPQEHYEFQVARLGEQNMGILTELKNDIGRGKEYRRTKGVGAIAKHYRDEYARMQREQSKQFAGWI
jgi:hypothetical protein